MIDALLGSMSCIKFRSEQLQHKIDREQLAWKLIREYKGAYTVKNLNRIFDIVDKTARNKRWFGPLLADPNRNNIFSHSIELINKWIDVLLFSGKQPIQMLNTCISEIHISGANKGLATLLLYLSDPSLYNIWLPSIERGLVELGEIKRFRGNDYSTYYQCFNNAAINIRNRYGLQPQEVDWALSFIPAYIKDDGIAKSHPVIIS